MAIPNNGHSTVLNGKFFIVGCGSPSTGVQAYNPITGLWETNYPALPTARGDGGVAADQSSGKIYDVGGYSGRFLDELDILPLSVGLPVITSPLNLDYLSTNEVFDPVNNTWNTTKARMPTAREGFGSAKAAGGQDGSWTIGAPMPGPAYGLHASFVNGKLYAIGGFSFGGQPLNRIYNPATNQWTTGAPLPADTGYNLRQYFGRAVVNGKIYVLGGDTGGSGVRDTNYVYDTAANTWASKAVLPGGARSGLAATTFNGKIYVIGGNDNSTPTIYFSRVDIYDPSNDTWSAGVPLPAARTGLVAEALNGKIYIAGGNDANGTFNSGLVFDPNNPGAGWTAIAPLPIAGVGHSTVLGGKFFIVGCGSNGAATAKNTMAYDPASNTWSTNYSLLPNGRGDGGVAADEATGKIYDVAGYNNAFLDELDILSIAPATDKVYVAGGRIANGCTPIATLEGYNPATDTWVTLAPMPTARWHLSAATVNGVIYFIGGQARSTLPGGCVDVVGKVEAYDPVTKLWTTRQSMSVPRYDTGIAVANNKIYVFGGNDGSGVPRKTVEVYDPATNAWASLSDMPTGRFAPAVGVVNNLVYVIGGFDGTNGNTQVEAYNPTSNSWATGFPPLPTPRTLGVGSGVINNKIYVFGGVSNSQEASTNEVYDPASNSWSVASPMPTARFDLGGVVVNNNQLFAIGGLLQGIARVGQPFVYQITATNQPTSYAIDVSTPLPDGLRLDTTSGIISGTPTTQSSNNVVKITARNASGSGSALITFSVQPSASSVLSIVNSTSVTGRTTQPFGPSGAGFQVVAVNANGVLKYTAGGLPAGLAIDSGTGIISGTPTSPGNYAVSLSVTDTHATANSILQTTVISDGAVPIISSAEKVILVKGQPFSYKITASGGAVTQFDVKGPLPPGLTFDGIDTISGTYIGGSIANFRDTTITIRPPLIDSAQPVATNGSGSGTGPLNFFLGYTITLNSAQDSAGSVSGAYNQDSTFTARATPANCYQFVNWTENGQEQSKSPNYTFIATSARTLTANFASASYAITALSGGGGAVTGGGNYACGATVTLTATSDNCHTFANWTDQNGSIASTSTSYNFTAASARTLTANFASINYSIVALSGGGGTAVGAGSYSCGSSVTLTATPDGCHAFVSWTEQNGSIASTSASYNFTATSPRTLTANFSLLNYTIGTSAGSGGTASGGGSFSCGSTITLTAVPDSGFSFSNWTENGSIVSSSAKYGFSVTADRNLKANFSPIAPPVGNISTRGSVGTGDNVMIGGFIIQGSKPKKVMIRAIGPSLVQFGLSNPLSDPMLELHDTTHVIATNDNWQNTQIGGVITADQASDIQNSGLTPTDASESAMIVVLSPGNYTAIVRGAQKATGIGLVEIYDLDPSSASILVNISTREFVDTGNNVMIGGFIIQGSQPQKVVLRAIGPSLTQFGIDRALEDPILELHDRTHIIATNDNWQTTQIGGVITSDQATDLRNSGLAPTQANEAAMIVTLPPGGYTAIVHGAGSASGVGLVEAYKLN